MLSYKSEQTAQPMYDYYVETDLDSYDQLVDYSKKYTDQDSYDVRRQSKSPKVLINFPSNSVLPHSQPGKQSCNDEVKVYYMEGTPLTISSASSLCDLRDIGVNSLVSSKNDVKKPEDNSNFTSVNDSTSLCESFSSKKQNDTLIANSSPDKGKEDINCKEAKSVTFRNEDDFSKASSPLMFSRSSSVCSLNSFEQQSLVDDRSSISIFSTLTSGIISPSELPDSPGEAASPGLSPKEIPARAISPILKNDADISKVDSDDDNESVNVLEDCILSSMSDEDADKAKDVDNSKTNAFQTGIQQLSYNNLYKSDDESDTEEDNALLQQCIELGMTKADGNESEDEHKMQDTLLSEDVSDTDEDDILLNQCIQLGMPQQSSKSSEKPNFVKLQPLKNEGKEDFKECKRVLSERGAVFLESVSAARLKISKLGQTFIVDGMNILIHSHSRVVYQTLIEAYNAKKRFHVYVTESAPDFSGKLMYEKLDKAGLACTMILDAAVGYVLEKVDLVFLGAEGVVESGGIINKIGTYGIAICAKEMHKPVYVLAESFKFLPLFPLNQQDLPNELKHLSSKVNSKEHPLIDYTPPSYITLLFSDLGILTPSAVSDELIKLYM